MLIKNVHIEKDNMLNTGWELTAVYAVLYIYVVYILQRPDNLNHVLRCSGNTEQRFDLQGCRFRKHTEASSLFICFKFNVSFKGLS